MLKNLFGIFLLFPLLTAAQMREVTFYEVRPAEEPPVLDGKLNDPVWQNVPVLSRYYQYGRPNPQESLLKTEFRAVYDARGLYVAIVNHDDKMEMLCRNIRENDNINLWRDDCAELYIDPEANGIGHTIFTINAAGVKGDRKRLDTAVSLPDWNGYGWLASVSVEKDRWILELFFPWEDLGQRAKAGDLWQFLHARYAWKPKFIGAASAAGADYRVTEKFGYLYFSGREQVSPQRIMEVLKTKVQKPCLLAVGNNLIRFTDSEPRIESMEKVLVEARREYALQLAEIKALHDGKIPEGAVRIVKRCDDLEGKTPLAAYQILSSAREELFRLKWEYYLKLNFNLPKGEKAE